MPVPEHVVVCGAGLVGAGVADALAPHVSTTLLEANEVAGATTGATFAWINASSKAPYDYHALNAAGVKGHTQLATELRESDWFHRCGTLLWRDSPGGEAQPPRFVGDLVSWNYPHRTIDREALVTLEPALAVETPIVGVSSDHEGWVDAPTLTGLLVARAEERGAKVRLGARIIGAERNGRGALIGVRLEDGERISCDAVVNCAGAGAADLACALGVPPPPLQPDTEGLLVRLAVDPVPVHAVIWSPTVHVRSDGPGVLLTGDDAVDGLLATAGQQAAVEELLRRTAQRLPVTAGAEVIDVRVGVRPKPVDGFSSVGALEGFAGYYEVVTHSGVTLAPVLASLLATELLTGQVETPAAPFRPDRFADRST